MRMRPSHNIYQALAKPGLGRRSRSQPNHSPASISDLFGSFRAELWEDDEFVITCKAGVIGHTIDKKASRWLPAWLNGALAEALSKAQQRSQTKKE